MYYDSLLACLRVSHPPLYLQYNSDVPYILYKLRALQPKPWLNILYIKDDTQIWDKCDDFLRGCTGFVACKADRSRSWPRVDTSNLLIILAPAKILQTFCHSLLCQWLLSNRVLLIITSIYKYKLDIRIVIIVIRYYNLLIVLYVRYICKQAVKKSLYFAKSFN